MVPGLVSIVAPVAGLEPCSDRLCGRLPWAMRASYPFADDLAVLRFSGGDQGHGFDRSAPPATRFFWVFDKLGYQNFPGFL